MNHFLTVIVPDQKAVKYALKGDVISIGRGAGNAIALDISAVSSHHLEIRKTDSGYQLLDLNSTNGTTVNGERISERTLQDGDDLVIGTAVRAVYAAIPDDATGTASAEALPPKVVEESNRPASPTVVLKQAPTPAAETSASQPVAPPSGIKVRKMTPPGVEAPAEPPQAQPAPEPDSESPAEAEADPPAPKLNLPGQQSRRRKLNLG